MKIEDQLYSVLNLYKRSPEPIRRALGVVYNKIPMRYRFGRHYPFFVDLLDETKTVNSAESYKVQLSHLNEQVALCKNHVPYYADVLAKVMLPSSPIEYFKAQIAFTTKAPVRNDHKDFLKEALAETQVITRSTGGTTGEP